jgi:hypothetical protein
MAARDHFPQPPSPPPQDGTTILSKPWQKPPCFAKASGHLFQDQVQYCDPTIQEIVSFNERHRLFKRCFDHLWLLLVRDRTTRLNNYGQGWLPHRRRTSSAPVGDYRDSLTNMSLIGFPLILVPGLADAPLVKFIT